MPPKETTIHSLLEWSHSFLKTACLEKGLPKQALIHDFYCHESADPGANPNQAGFIDDGFKTYE